MCFKSRNAENDFVEMSFKEEHVFFIIFMWVCVFLIHILKFPSERSDFEATSHLSILGPHRAHLGPGRRTWGGKRGEVEMRGSAIEKLIKSHVDEMDVCAIPMGTNDMGVLCMDFV